MMYKNTLIGAGAYYNIQLNDSLFIVIWFGYDGSTTTYLDTFLLGPGSTWEKL